VTLLAARARVVTLFLTALVLSIAIVLSIGFGLTSSTSAVGAVERGGTATGGLVLSRDQATWATELDGPLFLPGLPWAPGDVRASTFYVSNGTGTMTDVAIEVHRSAAADPQTDRFVTMSAYLGGDVTPATGATYGSTPIPVDGESHLVLLRDLRAGESGAVTLQASLAEDAPAGTSVDGDVLDFRASPSSAQKANESGGLRSAAHLELAPLFLGFALVGAGFLVWTRRRTRAGRRSS
jgi:hypothetical protein